MQQRIHAMTKHFVVLTQSITSSDIRKRLHPTHMMIKNKTVEH